MGLIDMFTAFGVTVFLAIAGTFLGILYEIYQQEKKEKQKRKKLGALYWYWKHRGED